MSVHQMLDNLGLPGNGADEAGLLHTRVALHNVNQLRDLLDIGLTPPQRAAHADALLNGISAPPGQDGVALMHRLIRHVVGSGTLSVSDHEQLTAALPIIASVTTQPTPTLLALPPSTANAAQTDRSGPTTLPDTTAASPTVSPTPRDSGNVASSQDGPAPAAPSEPSGSPNPGGPTAPTPTAAAPATPTAPIATPTGPALQVSTEWDVSTPDGSLRVIDLPNGIDLLDGGCIVARATPLHFACSTLTRIGAPPPGFGDFNIVGRPGGPAPTPPMPPGMIQAQTGAPGQCASNKAAGPGGQPGEPGRPGNPGTDGAPGNDGIASALATITITAGLNLDQASEKALTVATQAGPGGPGGHGGPGGQGQQGGNGGPGVTCGCTGNSGAIGGLGGKGGSGGRAGDGGNGVDAAGNIAVFLPTGAHTDMVRAMPSPAPAGQPGTPGAGGPGGWAGNNGPSGKGLWPTQTGPSGGPPGEAGGPGNPGKRTGAAAQITVTAP